MSGAISGVRASRAWSRAGLAQLASRVRADLAPGIAPWEAFPAREVLAREIAVDVGGRPLPVRARGSQCVPSDVWATTYMRGDTAVILFGPDTWSRLQADEGRARFSACHELAHVVLHGAELLEHGQLAHAIEERISPRDYATSSEWQANTFARFLLVPPEGLFVLEAEGRLTAATVRDTYAVSTEAAAVAVKAYRAR